MDPQEHTKQLLGNNEAPVVVENQVEAICSDEKGMYEEESKESVAIGPFSQETVLNIARICHQANKAYCESLGDKSQKDWEEAEDWQKQSAIKGVQFHLTGFRRVEDSHEAWAKEKISQGWRYGEVKDVEKKEHPCLRTFATLPEEQKAKDYLFRGIVTAFKDFINTAEVVREAEEEEKRKTLKALEAQKKKAQAPQ